MLCPRECAQGKPGFLLLPLPPRHVYPNTEGFLLAVATLPCELGSLLASCPCSHSAPFSLGSVPTVCHCRMSQSPAHGGSGGPCLAPGSWRREAEVSRGVRGLSLASRRSPGDSLCRAAPDGSWSQGRLQTMGGEQETPHGKQDLAPPPPPATAPWPLSFPCSREPFPQPPATGLRRGDGDAAARAGWGMRRSESWTKSRVGTPPAWARGSA